MRVVLVPAGSRGDFQPLLALAVGFQAAGHDVLLASSPDFAAEAAAFNIPYEAVGFSIRDWLVERRLSMTPLRAAIALVRVGREEMRNLTMELLPLVAGADLVIGGGAQISGPTVAMKAGVPYRFVAYTVQGFPSLHHAPFTIPLRNMPPWVNRGLWSLSNALIEHQLTPALAACHRELGLPPPGDLFEHFFTGARAIVAVDPEIQPVPSDVRLDAPPVGALHLGDARPLPDDVEAFIEAGSAPVYIGFGSMTHERPERTTRMVLDAVADVGCRAVISAGWAGLGGGDTPAHVKVLGPVSHQELFPRMAALVHHGGAGTTAQASRAGVPQLVVPHIFDQFAFGAGTHRAGLGPPTIARGRITASNLARALKQLLSGQYTERAAQVGQALRARNAVQSAVDILTRADTVDGRQHCCVGARTDGRDPTQQC